MVDIDTCRIVDLIESREMEDVSKWLSEFPNIKFVSRDGSPSYRAAITKALPDACQISDRFHILKNLTDAVILYFQKVFQGRIPIPLTTGTANIKNTILLAPSKREKILTVKKLFAEGKSKSEIKSITNLLDNTISKYINMSDDKIPHEPKTARGKLHEDAINKALSRANTARELKDRGYSLIKIHKETGFTLATIKRYLSEDFIPTNGHYGCQKPGLLAPFRDEVMQMRSIGKKYREIHELIYSKGYRGTEDAIRGFMSKEKRILTDMSSQGTDKPEPMEFIERKWLVKLLYKPLCKVKGITEEQFSAVLHKYPQVGKVYSTVSEFKEIMFSKNINGLNYWINNTLDLGIAELNSFINGIKIDIEAVNNAILLEYNNGLAEGSVNKLKVIKRIMYGRNKFDLLRSKVLLLESQ